MSPFVVLLAFPLMHASSMVEGQSLPLVPQVQGLTVVPQVQGLTLVPQVQGLTVVTLLFAAVAGDVTALHRHFLQVTTCTGCRIQFQQV